MAYILDEGHATVGELDDFGVIAPCPPPGGCPPGTRQNPKYPKSSATCCKPIPGYVPPEPVGFGTEAGTQSGSGMLQITPSGTTLPGITVGPKPPKPPIGTTGVPDAPGPSGPASGEPPVYISPFMNWLSQNKWWVAAGSAALVLAVAIMVWPSKKPATMPTTPATADWEY